MENVNEVTASQMRGRRVRDRSKDGYISKLKQLVSYIEREDDFAQDRHWVDSISKELKVPFDLGIALKVFGRLSRDTALPRLV